MDHQRPPPPPPGCLIPRTTFKPKGGTIIAEAVVTLDAHMARLADPDGYRPSRCLRCGYGVLHVHDYRERVLLGGGVLGANGPVRVVRHSCANGECGAVWQTVPAFVARHLWHGWAAVEASAMGPIGSPDEAVVAAAAVAPGMAATAAVPKARGATPPRPVAARTASRWRARLAASALFLVQVFAVQTGSELEQIAQQLGLGATRRELVEAYAERAGVPLGARLARVAGVLQRVHPGTRLA